MNYRQLLPLLLSLLLALVGNPHDVQAQGKAKFVSIQIGGFSKQHYKLKRAGVSFEVEFDGEISVNDDDTEVTGISPGGRLEISRSAFGAKRKLEIESDRKGELSYEYRVGWSEQDFDAEGRAWLAEVLPEVVRFTPVGAGSRVDRIYTAGGMAAIRKEFGELSGDNVQKTYVDLLLCKELTSAEYGEVLSMVGSEISSDHYLSGLLKDNARAFLGEGNNAVAFREAATSISSDHYLSELLRSLIREDWLTDRQLLDMLPVADRISSDHYLSETLRDLLKERQPNQEMVALMLKLGKSISSDHYLSEVMADLYRLDNWTGSGGQPELDLLEAISSDHYLSETIEKMLDRSELTEAYLIGLLEGPIGSVASDHYASGTLKKLVGRYPPKGALLDAVLKATGRVNSDHYATDVYKEMSKERFTDTEMVAILKSMSSISSDSYLSQALRSYAERAGKSQATKDAYLEAAETISSGSYYKDAVKAVL